MKIIFTLDEAVEALREKYRLAQGGASIVIARPRPLLKSNVPHWLDVLAQDLQSVPKMETSPGRLEDNKIARIRVLREHTTLGLAEAKWLIEQAYHILSVVGNRQTQFGVITLIQKKQG